MIARLANIIVIFQDKYLRVVFGLGIILILAATIIIIAKMGRLNSPFIIHFDSYRGIDLLGGLKEILLIPILAFIILLINFGLANFLYSRERFLSHIFAFVSLWLAILILIVVSVIISVN